MTAPTHIMISLAAASIANADYFSGAACALGALSPDIDAPQSTDPASPHYADQTWLYSKKGWHRLPFHAADIAADEPSAPLVLKGN